MSKVLISGVNGFVGKHLARELHGRGHSVVGVGRENVANNEIAQIVGHYSPCDLTNPEDVSKLPLTDIDAIINLAGLARVGESFKDPDRYNQINVAVLSVLGSRLVKEHGRVRLIAVSTGAVYDSSQSLPLREDSAITPEGSPYAFSKLLMEKAAEELRNNGLDCIVVRPFNHIGPGQESGFLLPDLYKKISESLKYTTPIRVGNLKTRRDYTDVRDVVKAYADLAEASDLDFDLYNVCSSKSIAGEEILEILLEKMDAKAKVKISADQSLIRKNDPPDLYGSYERLNKETGWTPKIKLEQTIKEFVISKREG